MEGKLKIGLLVWGKHKEIKNEITGDARKFDNEELHWKICCIWNGKPVELK
jgi:hypothetical protein